MKEAVVVIPALNPDSRLIEYCEKLAEAGFSRIVVIDDGSDEIHRPVFDALEQAGKIVLLRHAVNLGKGRALKTAFNYFLNCADKEKFCGVITVDSDGQHGVPDVIKIKEELNYNSENLILGVRDFDKENVPFKSRYGNKCTRFIFRLLHGAKLTDTQTGLRGIPTDIVAKYIDVFGERFEYETAMLITTAHNSIEFKEISIETIYENDNKGTHFNPVRDSWAIYKLLFGTFLKYIMSSLLSFLVDIGFFRLFLMFFTMQGFQANNRIIAATIIARIISSLLNFSINKNVVFRTNGNNIKYLIKYYVLCLVQMACSAGLVAILFGILPFSETPIKIIVDAFLFVISYQIQHRLIFRETEKRC